VLDSLAVSVLDQLVLRIKRGDSAATRTARDVYYWAQRWNLPESRFSRAVFTTLYRAHDVYESARDFSRSKLLYEPMVRARFHKVGKDIQVSALPYVTGHAQVSIGDGCRFGYFSIRTGRLITIHDNVGIGGRCWISDSDGHPADVARRTSGVKELDASTESADIKPLTIEEYVWVGHGVHILKGVTLGRGSVVAAGSVVTTDVPPGALAMGVPARIVRAW